MILRNSFRRSLSYRVKPKVPKLELVDDISLKGLKPNQIIEEKYEKVYKYVFFILLVD